MKLRIKNFHQLKCRGSLILIKTSQSNKDVLLLQFLVVLYIGSKESLLEDWTITHLQECTSWKAATLTFLPKADDQWLCILSGDDLSSGLIRRYSNVIKDFPCFLIEAV